MLGYTGDVAVSDDHFIVAARVTQKPSSTALLHFIQHRQQRSTFGPPDCAGRGLETVNTEWLTAVIAYNLGRLRCR